MSRIIEISNKRVRQPVSQGVKQTLQKTIQSFKNQQSINIGQKQFNLSIVSRQKAIAQVIVPKYYEQLDLSIKFNIDLSERSLKIILFLSLNNVPIAVKSRAHRNQIYKIFSRLNSKKQFWSPDLLISSAEGIIHFKLDLFYSQSAALTVQKFIRWSHGLLASSLSRVNGSLIKYLSFLNICSQNTCKSYNLKNTEFKITQSDQRLKNIFKHLQMSSFQKEISQKCFVNKQEMKFIQEPNNLQYITLKTKLNQKFNSKIKQIFAINHLYYHNQKDYQYKPGDLQLQDIQSFSILLKKPMAKICERQAENKYIFNCIHLINPQQIKARKFKEGGNSIIKIFCASFYYVLSLPSGERKVLLKNIVKKEYSQIDQTMRLDKVLCVKMPKDELHSQRINHQMRIVQQFRSSSSAYFFKYYISLQQDFPFSKNLLMDATKSPTLHDYLGQNSRIVSLRTKLFILCQIAQALSFLKDLNIVHMDLKKGNIIVMKQLQIKIFDFTQSYHESICDSTYEPGITMPYAPPEVFQPNRKKFDTSQDIFSFGIICFCLIFDAEPFQVCEKLYVSYANKTYLNHWFLAHEIGEKIYYQKLFTLILNFIYRCLSPNPKERPTPSWAIVILKQIFAYITSP